MASREQIKQWFKTFDKPLSSQFWEWLNSYWHKDDQIPIESIDGLTQNLQQKANKSEVDEKANKESEELFQSGDITIITDRSESSLKVIDKVTGTLLIEFTKTDQINSHGTPGMSPFASGAVNTYRNNKLRIQQTTVGGHFQLNMFNDDDELMCRLDTNGESWFRGGNVNLYGKKLTGLADATENSDAINKYLFDNAISVLLGLIPTLKTVGGATVTGSGNVDKMILKEVLLNEEYDNGDFGANGAIDWTLGQNQKAKLLQTCSISLPSVTGTARFQLKIIQNEVGGHSINFTDQTVVNPSNFDFSSGTANQECIITFYWDGAKYIFLSIPYYS